jgi:hypothetical protein
MLRDRLEKIVDEACHMGLGGSGEENIKEAVRQIISLIIAEVVPEDRIDDDQDCGENNYSIGWNEARAKMMEALR